VIKSLEQNYGAVDGISGATILGSGHVALILDVSGLHTLSRLRGPAPIALQGNTAPEHTHANTLH
ncbi:MAG: chemotaxis protein CheW, partial [Bradymonadia bacterium]